MASLFFLAKSAFLCVILISMVSVFASSLQFDVGGKKGWAKPAPTWDGTFSYNDWTTRNRFHVGDSLYFKYSNDSVLVVDKMSYKNCSASNPIFKFEDGETVFTFDRFGFFYFMSGKSDHCRAGQRLIARVMVHPRVNAPGPAPEGSGLKGGDGSDSFWGLPSKNSSFKLNVGSYLKAAMVGLLIIVCLFK